MFRQSMSEMDKTILRQSFIILPCGEAAAWPSSIYNVAVQYQAFCVRRAPLGRSPCEREIIHRKIRRCNCFCSYFFPLLRKVEASASRILSWNILSRPIIPLEHAFGMFGRTFCLAKCFSPRTYVRHIRAHILPCKMF